VAISKLSATVCIRSRARRPPSVPDAEDDSEDTCSVYKRWILQAIEGLRCLHSLGIVHRHLCIDNLVFSRDASPRLLICDLESRWGNHLAPEIRKEPILGAGWYDLSTTIKGQALYPWAQSRVFCWAPLDSRPQAPLSCGCYKNLPRDSMKHESVRTKGPKEQNV